MLFGLDVPTSATPDSDPVGAAISAERGGFDFISASDHPSGTDPTFETWTMLTTIAARTTRIGIATRVLGVPYRAPAIVAKMAETLHRLSGERLVLGLGGGASDDEFRAFGLRVPTPRDKVDGLEEAVRVLHGLWSEPAFTFRGRLHRTDSAELEPKPRTHIPVWLGTYGPRALEVTGRLADGWIPSLGHASPEAIPHMRERVLAAAREAGRDPSEITSVYNLGVRVDARAEPEPGAVVGSLDHVVERLAEFGGLGFAGFNFQPIGPDRVEQVDLLTREVVPALRRAAVG